MDEDDPYEWLEDQLAQGQIHEGSNWAQEALYERSKSAEPMPELAPLGRPQGSSKRAWSQEMPFHSAGTLENTETKKPRST